MNQQDKLFYQIIDSKVVDYCEVVVLLFEHCNMSCVFCPQNHDSMLGATKDEILSKVPLIVNYINSNQRSKYFSVHTMGGEVFQDRFIDADFLNTYQEYVDKIQEGVNPDKTVVVNFVTNLITNRADQLLEFLNRNNLKISISYDSAGRFTPVTLEIFKRNIEIFKDKIRMVSSVATKQNIDALIKGDAYFDYLYDNFTIDFDSLLPSTGTKTNIHMMPAESKLLEFNKLLVDKYPEVLNIQPFVNSKTQNKMSCTRGNSFTLMADNSVPRGCSGSVLLKDNITPDLGSTVIMDNFMKKYNCFECPFYQRCPFTCFIKHDFKHITQDLDDCVFKKTFEYADHQKVL